MVEFDTDNLQGDSYFAYSRLHHPEVNLDHCRIALAKYAEVRTQSDKKYQVWGQALLGKELKWIKVIVHEDRRTVHNAYPDRNYKPPASAD